MGPPAQYSRSLIPRTKHQPVPGTTRPDGYPACTIAVQLEGIDLVFEGEAARVTDATTLEQAVAIYRDGGWPAEVEADALTSPYSAPSAGPPPWHLYRLTFRTVFGVASAEPYGATRWRF